ncbi:MAG: DUF4294 domain-containing protein [Bacteroidota bacterium]
MITKIILIFTIILSSVISADSQIPLGNGQGYLVNCIIENGDTLAYIELRQVIIIPPRVFKNEKERTKYRKLVRNLKKVLPYARMAGEIFSDINNELPTIETEKERKKYLKRKDDELRAKFENELKELTISQGRLLIKLIDRETDNTTFQVIQDLRGNFTAFMWQSVARLFGSNLKTEFDAEHEDKYIEEIIILIDNGQL